MSILITSGRIVTAHDDYVADILVDQGTIKAIGTDLGASGVDRTIDATGKYLIPGGIDPHTHLDIPYAGLIAADDFYSGTVSAVAGGTTTIVDFAIQFRGQTLSEGLETWHKKADGKAVIDYGFQMIVTDLPEERLPDLDEIVRQGVTSFKLFMALPDFTMVSDDVIFRALVRSAGSGAMVSLHAEHGHMIDVLVKSHLAQGHTEPRYHAVTRPPASEAEATHRGIRMAQVAGAPVYFVHLSCKEALDEVQAARARGNYVYAETCPHYLTLDESLYDLEGLEGAKYVCAPPLREKWHQEELWAGLRHGDIQVVSSDHGAFPFKAKKAGAEQDFTKIPNGGPGIEHRLSLLYTHGVIPGHITMNRLVQIFSTNVATRFGLYPRKGTISAGSDADIVIFDPHSETTLSVETHKSNMDFNLYEGWKVKGVPEVVISAGKVVIENGTFLGKAGDGRFIKRGTQP